MLSLRSTVVISAIVFGAGARVYAKPAVKGCPVGQARTADTHGHCCWPGQVWATLTNACVGIPACPSGMNAIRDNCEPALDAVVLQARIGDAPARGGEHAKVTIVEWGDFQCPFCARVEPTLQRLLGDYGADLRIVFKQRPLFTLHPQAEMLAEAALAAKAQGRFWELYDALYANPKALDRVSVEQHAKHIGLDLAQFRSDLDTHRWRDEVAEESAEGALIGVSGTPTFFINGKWLAGAQPYDRFKKMIDAELANADRLIAAGTPPAQLYDAIMQSALPEAPLDSAIATQAANPTAVTVTVDGAPALGPPTAPVTVIEFGDYQCAFTAHMEPGLQRLRARYGNQVRWVFRNYPQPFHEHAELAAEAALAAGEQQQFWKMHDLLLANPRALDRATLEGYARRLGLDVPKWSSDLDSGRFKAAVEDDARAAAAAVLPEKKGTPTFYVNGRVLRGLVPSTALERMIDDELRKRKR